MPPPRLLADRYQVIEVIGSGATAITWRGHDQRLDRPVAIKILRRDGNQDPAFAQRFEREARLAASINDTHVVQVFDAGQQDGWLYLVMQYVEGQDLKALITDQAPLPLTRARDIALQILAGLEAIHQAGILHRDIKPQNVLLDRQGRVRVTDFGIAQGAFDAGLTADGTAIGTASYMAPEQARGGALSEASDVYAVGIILYEMLTGRLPFERDTPMATMLAQIEDEPVPPSEVAPQAQISPRIEGVVLQAMAKNPAHRFRTASVMARALEGAGSDPGVTTRLPQPPRDDTLVSPRPRPQTTRHITSHQGPPPGPPPRQAPPSAGGGGRGFLTFLLAVILLAMVAVAIYLVVQVLDRGGDVDTPAVTATTEQTTPTATATIEPSEAVIGPPTEVPPTPTPSPTPTLEPSPTLSPEPTGEPPIEPVETLPLATEDDPIIEPGS